MFEELIFDDFLISNRRGDAYYAALLQQGPLSAAVRQRIFEAWGAAIAFRKVWGLAA